MRHAHKWEEMLPEEFYEEFDRASIAYWGWGDGGAWPPKCSWH